MIRQPSLSKVPSGDRGDQRWRVAGVCVALAAITFAVFGQTLTHEFIDYDDDDYVYGNPMVVRGLTLRGVAWAFTHIHSSNWHPLTWLSHMLDCQLYGLHPGGHHFTNVLLHIATVIALFLVMRQMTGALWRSAFVAAVFAIHPLRAESVAWVAERKDVLSGLLFMLTIGAYVRYARHRWSPFRYGLVVFLYALGLMCKSMLVTLPVVMLLLDYWPLRRMESGKCSGLLMEKLPLLALSAAVCAVTFLTQKSAIQSAESHSQPLHLANALTSCMVYLGETVYPAELAAFYPYPHNGPPAWEILLAGMLVGALSAAAVWRQRTQPWLLTGWLWYLVMLTPVVGIIQVGAQAHADRYTYLPQIGIYVAVTWLVAEWTAKSQVSGAAIGALMGGAVAVLMVCAWKQTTLWKNSETLWTHALVCTRDNFVAEFEIGNIFLHRGDVDDAITQYQKALQIKPDYAEAHLGMGNAFLRKGLLDEAITAFQNAVQINPEYMEGQLNLGNVLAQQGRADEALAHFDKALRIAPTNPTIQNSMAWLLATCPAASLRNGPKAVELAQQANSAMDGANPIILRTLAAALAEAGRYSEAVETLHRALRLTAAQSNAGLTGALQSELKLYQAGRGFNGPMPTH